MKSTLIAHDGKALEWIKKGVLAIYEPVRRTLGPECGTTLMYRTYNRGPRNVDDGFYTAEVIQPKNPFVRIVVEFVREAIKRTNEKVGDGTSSTAVIMGVLFLAVYRIISPKEAGFSLPTEESDKQPIEKKGAMQLKKQILEEAVEVKEKIRASAKKVKDLKDLEKIATVSLGDAKYAGLVAGLAHEVGTDGYIDVVEGYKGEVETEVIRGMRFPAKTCGKVFVNKPERYEMIIEDAPVFITNHKLDNVTLMGQLVKTFKQRKLIVAAPDFSEEVLVSFALSVKNSIFISPVKIPALRTEQMEDIAIYCGALLCDKSKGDKLENVSPASLGFLTRLVVKDTEAREDAVAIGGFGETNEGVKNHIEQLRKQMAEQKDNRFKIQFERRIASMASAIGVIRVGSSTDAENLTLKLKIEDCVYACRAALRGGYVKGGGLCLKEIAEKLPDTYILKEPLKSVYDQIQENSGGIEIGEDVIDPADAVYYAVEHATSVVSSLITVKNIIPEERELEPGEGEMFMGRMILENAIAMRRHLGLLKESEEYAERERALAWDETMETDKG